MEYILKLTIPIINKSKYLRLCRNGFSVIPMTRITWLRNKCRIELGHITVEKNSGPKNA